jgi:hypothetical protein
MYDRLLSPHLEGGYGVADRLPLSDSDPQGNPGIVDSQSAGKSRAKV